MSKKDKILIVEDEFIVAYDLKLMLTKGGYLVTGIASSVERALQYIEEKKPDWVLIDIILKGNLTGIDLAQILHKRNIPFLFISANTNHSSLESAKKTQPYGFLVKPFRDKDLFVMLDIARHRYGIERGLIKTETQVELTSEVTGLIGKSPFIKELSHKIQIVAPTPTSVLILGESGTGKEKVAKAIYTLSHRNKQPFITVNCAALPINLIESELFGHEKGAFTGANQRRIGKFEQAHGGTIFLDEIGEMPLEAQVKLLRVLQEKEFERIGSDTTLKVDIRVIAATNRNLEKEVSEGRFRLDLYYRLNVFPLELLPLHERKEDIEDLASYFLEKYGLLLGKKITSLSVSAQEKLQSYAWPGNIRELEHCIERAVLMANDTEINTIPIPELKTTHQVETDKPSAILTMEEMEKEHIINTLKASNGKVSGTGGAAELLGISAQTLYSKMKKHGIKLVYK
ncbi:sigma-54-dependent transcriptional regulator [Flectobacillus longus]|uniref:sigma-54-dependent transcriptional regulator n=1 Tax=Flectobacillus longus TaxID=2984207 RepID=UPI0024B7E6BE|nr:sigma-54 dependent transcriptional regulator [Flectobacillus longus]MDI9882346.1 sigma-54 dependent transcriptional regulator [Flectobacillus longus]